MIQDETPIQLDLNVETLALLGEYQSGGGEKATSDFSAPIRCCGGTGSMCTPPTCCP
jgi:hypothetical protein